MTSRRAIWLVTRREMMTRIRERGFQVSFIIMLLVIVIVALLPRFIDSDSESFDVGLVGQESMLLQPDIFDASQLLDVSLETKNFSDEQSARNALESDEIDALIVNDRDVTSKERLDDQLAAVITTAHQTFNLEQGLRDAGVPQEDVADAIATPPLNVVLLEGDQAESEKAENMAFIAAIVLFGQFIAYGSWIALGVVEEKSSRVVELLLASLRPWQLLTGKVIGIGILALVQLVVITLAGLGVALISNSVDISGQISEVVVSVFIWFVLGFAFFACAYAAAAALVSRQEDLNNVTSPMSIALISSYFVAVAATQNPDGVFARVVSLIPPFSAITMPARMVAGSTAWWEITLSVGLMLLATFLLIRLAAGIYSRVVLHTGAPVRLRNALRTSNRTAPTST